MRDRKFDDVKDEIPCFSCKHYVILEYFVKPRSWCPYCLALKTTCPKTMYRADCTGYELSIKGE